jgi:hypothetical protein
MGMNHDLAIGRNDKDDTERVELCDELQNMDEKENEYDVGPYHVEEDCRCCL